MEQRRLGHEQKDRISVVPGRTNDRAAIQSAVSGCDGVLTVLVPWGMDHYASGTAQAVLDSARDDARLVFSCGWLGRLIRAVDVNDQVEACQRIFASEGLPVWARHVGDPLLESNRTRRTDFAMFLVDALTNPELVREAPAIVSCASASAVSAR